MKNDYSAFSKDKPDNKSSLNNKSSNDNSFENSNHNFSINLSKGIQVFEAISGFFSLISAIKSFKDSFEGDETWECLPGEAEHEKQLAEERKNNGDKFYPSFEEYISTINEAKKLGCNFIVKAKTHMFSKWEWVCCCKKK